MKRTTTLETALRLGDGGRKGARPACTRLPRRQTGIALVMTLVFLTILIILALASMSTTTLEERMSGNMQDMYHAFQAADSSLKSALTDAPADAVNQTSLPTYSYGSSVKSSSTVTTTFRQYAPLKPGTGGDIYDKTKFDSGIFDQVATAYGPGNSKVTIARGMAQVVNKAQ